jgi:hypothetical protein
MSTNLALQIYPEALRSLAFGSIGIGYMGIGTALLNPAHVYYLVNTTDALLVFSWDGVTDHFVIPAGSYILIDVTTNRTETGGAFMVSKGTRTYVRGAPSMGVVYLSSFYGANG